MNKQWDFNIDEDDSFFRWIVDEVNTHVDYEKLLFPTKPTPSDQVHQSFHNDFSVSYYCLDNSYHDTPTTKCPRVDWPEIDYQSLAHTPNKPTYVGDISQEVLYQSQKLSQNKRMGKLWEFLRNLLLDEKTCPSLIKWDNYAEGTFKFVQSEKVAQMWGNRKNNTKMNYEKLSRAMRYYYRTKVLLPVAGKRLVYKFGPRATGWRTMNPILG